ncbi:hypothetical protein [Marinobacter caseinilyticus]|nr:hypothetical protein [Marinobacter caseinilyticus]
MSSRANAEDESENEDCKVAMPQDGEQLPVVGYRFKASEYFLR